ncbi:Ser/Thr protein phosphatase [Histomonas meleagridis]|uniref:Ser/Thr protein phosphatase n=1 Tax=Histomonas meleagridis TaxID=135588 RepID=UPI00355A52DE|nr:Ser/Thr protein phosphatase [Histomonas meleagridis]KAH0799778.1 Ser/Thr protein phosphatase [Histomonas meleagridis]
MQDNELKDIVFQILMSYSRNECHCSYVLQHPKIKHIVDSITSLFRQEPIRKSLYGQLVVVGDIHGDIGSLVRIFHKFDFPPQTSYLFLGDYVDRGSNSIEVLLLLYALKLLFPDNIHLLRGNHESSQTTKSFGFYSDCISYLTSKLYYDFLDSFSYMPISAILNDKIFCVHGGISKLLHKVTDIDALERPLTLFCDDLFVDLLWSDPLESIDYFKKSDRGLGHFFGQMALDQFLDDNNLSLIIRAHECQDNGFLYSFEKQNCLTVFSASNYCGLENDSSVAIIDNECEVKIVRLKFNEEKNPKERIILPQWIISNFLPTKEPVNDSIVNEILTPPANSLAPVFT